MKCALIYDFDGTLAEGDCAQHGLMPAMGITDPKIFWGDVKARAKSDDGDEILSYLGMLADIDRAQGGNKLSVSSLNVYGREIPLFVGVEDWFDRINLFAEEIGVRLEHYIISSGLQAMIEGTSIAGKFKHIYACKYHYENDGSVGGVSQAINYTTKTQFLFRINKGIENSWDNESLNKFVEMKERSVPFEHMIYFGDGDTDIPSMKMVRMQGGFSIAVFDVKKWKETRTQEKVEKLISEERANYVVPANYGKGEQLDVTVKGLLKLFKRKSS